MLKNKATCLTIKFHRLYSNRRLVKDFLTEPFDLWLRIYCGYGRKQKSGYIIDFLARFGEAPETLGERKMHSLLKVIAFCEFNQSPLSPMLFSIAFFDKRGKCCFCRRFYGRFLNIRSSTAARVMMIKTNRPAIAGTKYTLATDVGVAVGAAVAAGAAVAIKDVSAEDP